MARIGADVRQGVQILGVDLSAESDQGIFVDRISVTVAKHLERSLRTDELGVADAAAFAAYATSPRRCPSPA